MFVGVETDADGVIANAHSLSTSFRLKDNFRPEILGEFSEQFTRKVDFLKTRYISLVVDLEFFARMAALTNFRINSRR